MNTAQAIGQLENAKAAAAVGAEFAPEYIEKFGARFYYKTVSERAFTTKPFLTRG